MAIAFDAVVSKDFLVSAGPVTWTHTCTGPNLALVVAVTVVDTSGGGPSAVSAITYNGSALTFIRRDTGSSNATELWYHPNPSTGANTMSVTLDHAPLQAAYAGSISLTGVNTASPDAHNGASGAPGTPSVTVTTVADNAWIIDGLIDNANENLTPGGSQVERWEILDASQGRSGHGSTLGPITPAAATAMTWSGTTSNWATSAVSFAPLVTIIAGLGQKHMGFNYARPYL